MTYNVKVKSFAVTGGLFESGMDKGCYVERGSADGPGVVDRMEVLPTGAIHDMDGSAVAARIPPRIWQEFVFQAAHPAAHTQYKNLIACVGGHGTLTLEVPGMSAPVTQTAQARMVMVQGSWEAPYAVGKFNTLVIRAEWQLKEFLG